MILTGALLNVDDVPDDPTTVGGGKMPEIRVAVTTGMGVAPGAAAIIV